MRLASLQTFLTLSVACGGGSGKHTPDAAGSACALTNATTPSGTDTNGCALLVRDTSACMSARTSQGLSGAWLQFSCRVTLTKMTAAVHVTADSRPDYTSNYFMTTDPCYAAYTTAFPDPNKISVQPLALDIPLAPNTTNTAMKLGAVGVALNGVEIFDNQAAPGDDIFTEARSFDRCGGHPAPGGAYHYHGEPFAISSDDSRLIGVLRDGYFVYGRRDADSSLPTLDSRGGHVGTTPDSTSAVYHYHLNLQTSTTPGTSGEQQWFLTTGTYEGSTL